MVINTNMAASNAATNLADSSKLLAKSLARLSSGSKIASIEDDVAGSAVSLRFDSQISRAGAAGNNVANAISFSQTQDGYLQKIGKALDRMSELTTLSLDVTKDTTKDVALYQKEFDKLAQVITDIASKKFNGNDLFGGSDLDVTTGTESSDTFSMIAVDLADVDIGTQTLGDSAATDAVNDAIDALADQRSTVGSNISALSSYSDQLSVLKNNLTAANSRIKDVDVAEESTQFARYNILVQAGTAMLAQANTSTQSALRLLQ
jgi:flagellin